MKYTLLLFICNTILVLSQSCGFTYLTNKDSFKQNYNNIYDIALNRMPIGIDTYYIPVVFHILYNNDSQNLPDSVILSQIEVLNEDYRRLNENASNTREEFLEFAGDANIEFFLANIDPNGNTTNGIIHQYTNRTEFNMFNDLTDILNNEFSIDEVKSSNTGGSDSWDTNKYLNIWVCNIAPLDFGIPGLELGQIFGYAYPPTNIDEAIVNLEYGPDWPVDMLTDDQDLQGVVIHYTTLGRNNPSANDDNMTENNSGRTAVHEIGHYLGLRHIWGDANALFGANNGCDLDDGIIDTPNASDQAGYICDFNKNTCDNDNFGSNGQDLPDMVENYMDYSPDQCLNIFTNGQINVMRNVLEICRPNLINYQPELVNIDTYSLEYQNSKKIVKIIDVLGRESNQGLTLHLYQDGTVKKKYLFY